MIVQPMTKIQKIKERKDISSLVCGSGLLNMPSK